VSTQLTEWGGRTITEGGAKSGELPHRRRTPDIFGLAVTNRHRSDQVPGGRNPRPKVCKTVETKGRREITNKQAPPGRIERRTGSGGGFRLAGVQPQAQVGFGYMRTGKCQFDVGFHAGSNPVVVGIVGNGMGVS